MKILHACHHGDHAECEQYDGFYWCECDCHHAGTEPVLTFAEYKRILTTSYDAHEIVAKIDDIFYG